jgi:hypothetical protein
MAVHIVIGAQKVLAEISWIVRLLARRQGAGALPDALRTTMECFQKSVAADVSRRKSSNEE